MILSLMIPLSNAQNLVENCQNAQQSGFQQYNTDPKVGCDTVFWGDNSQKVGPSSDATLQHWWQVTLASEALVNNFIIINENFNLWNNLQFIDVQVGSAGVFTSCLTSYTQLKITDGGIWKCGRTGTDIKITSAQQFAFFEFAAFSQFYLAYSSIKPGETTQMSVSYPLIPSWSNIFVVQQSTFTRPHTCQVSESSQDPILYVNFGTAWYLDTVVIIPGKDQIFSDMATGVSVSQEALYYFTDTITGVVTEQISGTQQCGGTYTYSTYEEWQCPQSILTRNRLVIKRSGVNQLAVCGVAVLSNCDCLKTNIPTQTGYLYNYVTNFQYVSNAGDPPQTLVIPKQETITDFVSLNCGYPMDGLTFCGQRKWLFYDMQANPYTLITSFPYKWLNWDVPSSTLTLTTTPATPVGYYCYQAVLQLVNHPTKVDSNNKFCFIVQQMSCNLPSIDLNLITATTIVKQSSYDIQPDDVSRPEFACDGQYQTQSQTVTQDGTSNFLTFWSAQIDQTQTIITVFLLLPDSTCIGSTCQGFGMKIRIGPSSSIASNPICSTTSSVSQWYQCTNKLDGTYLSVDYFDEPTKSVKLTDFYAYTYYAVQSGAIKFIQSDVDSLFPAMNLKSQIAIRDTVNSGQRCSSSLDTATDPTLTVEFVQEIAIEGTVVVSSTAWQLDSTTLDVYVVNISGTKQLCGQVASYQNYAEVKCGFQGNKVIMQRIGTPKRLGICSLGILTSSCNCAISQIDNKKMPVLGISDVETQTVETTVGAEPVDIITFYNTQSPDSISLTCHPFDGISFCGPRMVQFYDQCNKQMLSSFPSFFKWDEISKVTIQTKDENDIGIYLFIVHVSLQNYPSIKSQVNLNVTVKSDVFKPYKPCYNYRQYKLDLLISASQIVVDPCLQTVIKQNDNLKPELKNVTLVSYQDQPLTLSITNITDSTSQNFGKQNCGNYTYYLIKQPGAPVSFDSVSNAITFLTKSKNVGNFQVSVLVGLQNYASIKPLVFPFDFNLLSGQKLTQIRSKNSTQDIYQNQTDDLLDYQSEKIRPEKVLDAVIQSIDQLGNVTIQFSAILAERNLTQIHNSTVLVNGKRLPSIQLNIISQRTDPPKFQFKIHRMVGKTVILKLIFTNQDAVSIGNGDILQIKFNDVRLFQGSQGQTLIQGTKIYKQIPPQMPNTWLTMFLLDLTTYGTPTAQTFTIVNFTLSMIVAASLSQLWSMINTQQIIVMILAFAILPPGNVALFSNVLFQIASVDIIPWTDINEKILKLEHTEPLTDTIGYLGYGDLYFINNCGSTLIPVYFVPLQILTWVVLKIYPRVSCLQRLRRWIAKNVFWNGPITTITETYSQIITSAFIGFYAIGWKTFGTGYSATLSLILVVFYMLYPFILLTVFLCKFTKLDSLRDTIGNMYADIRLKSGRVVVLIILSFFFRRIVLAYTLVFAKNFFIQYFCTIFFCLFQVITIGQTNCYDSVERRRLEFFNETITTLIMYTVLTFTDAMPNARARYDIGFLTISLTLVHFLVCFIILVKQNMRQIKFVYMRIQMKHCPKKKNIKKPNQADKLQVDPWQLNFDPKQFSIPQIDQQKEIRLIQNKQPKSPASRILDEILDMKGYKLQEVQQPNTPASKILDEILGLKKTDDVKKEDVKDQIQFTKKPKPNAKNNQIIAKKSNLITVEMENHRRRLFQLVDDTPAQECDRISKQFFKQKLILD